MVWHMAYIRLSVCLSVCLSHTMSDTFGCVRSGHDGMRRRRCCYGAGISVAVALLTAVVIGLLVLVAGLAYFRSVTHHHPLAHSRSLLRCIGEQ